VDSCAANPAGRAATQTACRGAAVARPWRKRSAWPYVSKKGRKSYTVGFYDHDKRETSRSFPSAAHARAWMRDYITAERRGSESLRRFLLDLDAKQANEAQGVLRSRRPLVEVLDLYLRESAHPANEGGLAPSTYDRYLSVINCHLTGKQSTRSRPPRYARKLGATPAVELNTPRVPRQWREQMIREGATKAARTQAWQVLSAALAWAASSELVPEIEVNGCSLAGEPRVNRRRSLRDGGTGYRPHTRPATQVSKWALPPAAIEAIRTQLLSPSTGRRMLLAQRDAIILCLQYGLALRNQEVWLLRWSSINQEHMWITEVLSGGVLSQTGKTEQSANRRTLIPSLLTEDLADWRSTLTAGRHPTRDLDFIIPGDLAGQRYGTRDPRTGACHATASQAKSWGTRFFARAVNQAAMRPELVNIHGATPYALRRGGISLRLRAEDPQIVARECGTSLTTLSNHYAYAIEDLRRHGPRPADQEWRQARAEEATRQSSEESGAPQPAAAQSARWRGGLRGLLGRRRSKPLL
jgi:integrase